jgi:putative ATP-binding cassette transporter
VVGDHTHRWRNYNRRQAAHGLPQPGLAINIRLSFFNRDWFNSIQNEDSAAFWSLLFGVFCFWAPIALAVIVNLEQWDWDVRAGSAR